MFYLLIIASFSVVGGLGVLISIISALSLAAMTMRDGTSEYDVTLPFFTL